MSLQGVTEVWGTLTRGVKGLLIVVPEWVCASAVRVADGVEGVVRKVGNPEQPRLELLRTGLYVF